MAGETILVVEDFDDIAQVATAYLRAHKYEVLNAREGKTALEIVARHRPACILLDIMMPKMSGYDVLRRLRANPETADIPVILVTAKSRDEDVRWGYEVGADYYITKPYSADQLIRGVRFVLGQLKGAAPGRQAPQPS